MIPKTVFGVSIYVFLVFAMVTILFLDTYQWTNFGKYLTPKSKQAEA
jgi:hypothetical protein